MPAIPKAERERLRGLCDLDFVVAAPSALIAALDRIDELEAALSDVLHELHRAGYRLDEMPEEGAQPQTLMRQIARLLEDR